MSSYAMIACVTFLRLDNYNAVYPARPITNTIFLLYLNKE